MDQFTLNDTVLHYIFYSIISHCFAPALMDLHVHGLVRYIPYHIITSGISEYVLWYRFLFHSNVMSCTASHLIVFVVLYHLRLHHIALFHY